MVAPRLGGLQAGHRRGPEERARVRGVQEHVRVDLGLLVVRAHLEAVRPRARSRAGQLLFSPVWIVSELVPRKPVLPVPYEPAATPIAWMLYWLQPATALQPRPPRLPPRLLLRRRATEARQCCAALSAF